MDRSLPIDMLRAIAVLLVFERHIQPSAEVDGTWLHAITSTLHQAGWIGVDLFFVLSGFLVSGLLFREYKTFGKLDITRFLIRRGLRIYPGFYVLLACTIGIIVFRDADRQPAQYLGELFFLQNYVASLWSHTWSLAVEEHFYLLLVFTLWVLGRRKDANGYRRLPALTMGIALACLAARLVTALTGPYDWMRNYTPSHLRFDSLFFGVLLSYWYHTRHTQFMDVARRHWKPLLFFGVLLISPPFWLRLSHPFIYVIGFTLLYVGSGCLLLSALGAGVPSNPFTRSLGFIGRNSYSIYLWHLQVIAMAELLEGRLPYLVIWAVALAGSITAGAIMATIVEFPALRFRDRFFPAHASPKQAPRARSLQPVAT